MKSLEKREEKIKSIPFNTSVCTPDEAPPPFRECFPIKKVSANDVQGEYACHKLNYKDWLGFYEAFHDDFFSHLCAAGNAEYEQFLDEMFGVSSGLYSLYLMQREPDNNSLTNAIEFNLKSY